jgi:hypothetical protein
MTLPMVLRNHGPEGNSEQQDHKRQYDRPVRSRHDHTQSQNHLAIGLLAARSVNESRAALQRQIKANEWQPSWAAGSI